MSPAAVDDFRTYAPNLESPLTHIEAVTPSDAVDLLKVSRVLAVTTAGDVGVIMQDGSTDVLPACQPGVWYSARVSRVLVTGTSATGIKSLS